MRLYYICLLLILAITNFSFSKEENLKKGVEFFRTGKKKKAKRFIKKSDLNPDTTLLAVYDLAFYQLKVGLHESSIKTYQYVIENDSLNNTRFCNLNIGINYFNLEEHDSTILYMQREIKDVANDPSHKSQFFSHKLIALCYLAKEELDSAIFHFQKAQHPTSLDDHITYLLVLTYQLNGQYDKALLCMDYAFTTSPNNPELLALRAAILLDKEDNEAALHYYERALENGYKPGRKTKKIIRLLRKEMRLANKQESIKN